MYSKRHLRRLIKLEKDKYVHQLGSDNSEKSDADEIAINVEQIEEPKIKRIQLSTLRDNEKENSDGTTCKCYNDVLKVFEEKFTDLDAEIKDLKKTIQSQNESIMQALATQKIVTQTLVRQEQDNVHL